MKRASYKDAISWLAAMDDNEWLDSVDNQMLSVSASLVVHIFDVDNEKIIKDLKREIEKLG